MVENCPKVYSSMVAQDNYRLMKVLAVASLSDREIENDVKVNDSFGCRSESFLKKFPFGKLPVMELNDGSLLEQSDALAFYFASDDLLLRKRSKYEQSLIFQYVSYAGQDLNPIQATLTYPAIGIALPDKSKTVKALEVLHKNFSILNNRLSKKTYLVGERITLADISVLSELLLPLKYSIVESDLDVYPHLKRWFSTVINHPKMPDNLKGYEFCRKVILFNSNVYNKLYPKEQEQKPKVEVPKKDVEAKKAPIVNPKKKVDLFANLPPSKFVIDEWKRMYSNNDTKTVALPWLWENLDREAYSFWFCEYKYDNELTKPFMACNLINGTFSTAESLTKYLFASFILFGSENNLKIKGVWLQRGHDLIFSLDNGSTFDPDIFNFTKLSLDNEADKKIIENYFSWEGDFGGLEFNQGKIFK